MNILSNQSINESINEYLINEYLFNSALIVHFDNALLIFNKVNKVFRNTDYNSDNWEPEFMTHLLNDL